MRKGAPFSSPEISAGNPRRFCALAKPVRNKQKTSAKSIDFFAIGFSP
jgi:hypothetical protein